MEKESGKPVCAQEALDLLNCVTESGFDQERCVRLMQSLRKCVLAKKVKKFSIPDQDLEGATTSSKRP